MKILSIDPGLTNLGCCIYDTKTNKIDFADKISLAVSLKAHRKSGESAIVERVNTSLFSNTSPIKKYLKDVDVCIIEIQMKSLYKIISHVISSFCFLKKIKVFHISPRSVKKHFRTSSGMKTSKKAHSVNKKLAIDKCESLFPKFMSRFKKQKKKRDDVADALLQAIYFKENMHKF